MIKYIRTYSLYLLPYTLFFLSSCEKEITIETPAQLEAQHQKPTAQQLDEQKDKAIKFQAYYQKPERCVSPSTNEIRVQCGNEYMRAKTKFEEHYQQGKLKN